MTRVALYTRVSTDDQAKHGFSLPAQLKRLRAYAQAQGWKVAGQYVDDGRSARDTGRTAYKRMMADRAKWDTILVLKMDRIHRNSRNFMDMMDLLKREGKGFASVTESFDTETAMGRFVMDILQRIAQLGSESIAEGVIMGMKEKYESKPGIWMGKLPWVFRLRRGVLVPIPERVPAVVRCFREAAQGKPAKQIAKGLNDDGLTAGRPRGWRGRHVQQIVRSPAYVGDLIWGEHLVIKKHHPAIVPRSLYNRAQLKEAETSARHSPHAFRNAASRKAARIQEAPAQAVLKALDNGRLQPASRNLPYGYGIDSSGRIVLIPRQAKIVRYIFAAYERGLGKVEIARRLNESGSRAPRGGLWSPGTVQTISKNRAYAGEWKVKGTVGRSFRSKFPAIIAPKRFAALQQRRSQRRQRASERRQRDGLSFLT